MTNTPHDVAQHLTVWTKAACSRCPAVRRIQGERTRYSVGEYLISKGWSATDDELVCPDHAEPVLTAEEADLVIGAIPLQALPEGDA